MCVCVYKNLIRHEQVCLMFNERYSFERHFFQKSQNWHD